MSARAYLVTKWYSMGYKEGADDLEAVAQDTNYDAEKLEHYARQMLTLNHKDVLFEELTVQKACFYLECSANDLNDAAQSYALGYLNSMKHYVGDVQ